MLSSIAIVVVVIVVLVHRAITINVVVVAFVVVAVHCAIVVVIIVAIHRAVAIVIVDVVILRCAVAINIIVVARRIALPSLSLKPLSVLMFVTLAIVRVDVRRTVAIVVDAVAPRAIAIIVNNGKTPVHWQRQ